MTILRLIVLFLFLAALGVYMNQAVIHANQGWMPVLVSDDKAVWMFYRDSRMDAWNTAEPMMASVTMEWYYTKAPVHLAFLADRFLGYSWGDLLLIPSCTLAVMCSLVSAISFLYELAA